MSDDVTIENSTSDSGPFRGPLAVLISDEAFRDVWRHADSDTSREIGGVLVGRVISGPGGTVVQVQAAWPAEHTEASSVHVKFTHETWQQWHSRLDDQPDDICIVGWYHTHPDLGIFLSQHDLFIHRHFFNQPWQIAIVVDPVSREYGCFGWRDGDISPLPDSALYTPLSRTDTNPGHAEDPDLGSSADPSEPTEPDEIWPLEFPRHPTSTTSYRLWWLGWGVAAAMFLVLVLQVIGSASQLRARRALEQISSIRRELSDIRSAIADLEPPRGRWYMIRPGESLRDVCRVEYGDESLAEAVAALNGIPIEPPIPASIWLPAREALVPPGGEPVGAENEEPATGQAPKPAQSDRGAGPGPAEAYPNSQHPGDMPP